MAIAAMRVPTIFVAVDRFSDVVTKMTAKTSAFGKTAEAAAMRTSRSFNNVGNKMLGAGIGIATGIGFAVNEAAKFEKSIASVSTLTNNTPAEMKKIGDSILNMSKKVPVAMSDLTVGMYDTVSAGITGTANQLEVLNRSARLAVAGLGTTKEAVNITTSSLNAFGIEASKAEGVTNLLMKAVKYGKTTVSGISESFGAFASIMKNSNVSLEEYLATSAALTTTGMSMSRAQTQVSSATSALIKPNKTMMKIYQKLGVKDVPNFIKQSGGLVNTLEKVGGVATKMGLRMGAVLGRKEGLSAYLSLLGAQKGKFHEIMNDMVGGADVVNTAFAKQQATLSAKIQLMKNNLTVLAVKIGDVLIPRIKDLVDSIVPIIQNITSWSERNKGFANTLMTVAKWTLILGITAKILAFAFRTYAFYLRIATAVTEAYTFVSTMAALSNVSFGQSLLNIVTSFGKYIGSTIAATTATLAMTGAMAGGVAIVGWGLYKVIQGLQNMSTKQDYALRSVSLSWKNATFNIATEIAKQQKLIADYQNPNTKKGYDASKLYDINPNITAAQDKINYMSKYKNLPESEQQKALLRWNVQHTPSNTNFRLPTEKEFNGNPANLAGSSALSREDILNIVNGKSGKLELNISTDSGTKVDVIGKIPSGIDVITKPNQGSRDTYGK